MRPKEKSELKCHPDKVRELHNLPEECNPNNSKGTITDIFASLNEAKDCLNILERQFKLSK